MTIEGESKFAAPTPNLKKSRQSLGYIGGCLAILALSGVRLPPLEVTYYDNGVSKEDEADSKGQDTQ